MTISTLILAGILASAQLVSIDARDMELSDFFRLMGNVANINVVLHPAVHGKLNLMIKEAPWEQVLDVVIKNHGLEKQIEGNIMRIVPSAVLDAENRQKAVMEEARLNALPVETKIYVLSYAKADDMALVISQLLSPRGSVTVYRPMNAVIVRDVVPPPQSVR